MLVLAQLVPILAITAGGAWIVGFQVYVPIVLLFAGSFFVMLTQVSPWPRTPQAIVLDLGYRVLISITLALIFPALPIIFARGYARDAAVVRRGLWG